MPCRAHCSVNNLLAPHTSPGLPFYMAYNIHNFKSSQFAFSCQKLIEKLANAKLDIPEVTQSEFGQKQKLSKVLDTIKEQMNLPKWNQSKWTVDG